MKLATRLVLGLLLLSQFFCWPSSSVAGLVKVPGNYLTIQLGIWASGPGDTVLVGPGTYPENIVMGDGVVVLSSGGAAATVIDGAYAATVVTMSGVTGCVLEGFTVKNGFSFTPGAGISAEGSSGRIIGNIIADNLSSSHGGGIYLANSDFEIVENEILRNRASANGPGVAVIGASNVEIRGNLIGENNVIAPYASGGGIYLEAVDNATIEYNIIVCNRADANFGAGAGIYCGAASAFINHNTIVDNWFIVPGFDGDAKDAGPGVGIYIQSLSATIANNIVGTVAPDFAIGGAAIYCDGGSPSFSHNDVWNNDAFNPSPEYEGDCEDQTGLNGNIKEDPRFCDPTTGDYQINCQSPCVGAGEGGSDIGALGIGCGSSATESRTWGSVKQIFR